MAQCPACAAAARFVNMAACPLTPGRASPRWQAEQAREARQATPFYLGGGGGGSAEKAESIDIVAQK